MGNKRFIRKWTPLLLTVAAALVLFWVGWHRLRIDTDIVDTLPSDDPVLSDAGIIVRNHPMQDLVVIDLQLLEEQPPSGGARPEPLVEAAEFLEQRLVESGLFRQVGTRRYQELIPLLFDDVTRRLPLLFTEQQLNSQVAPLLQAQRLRQHLDQNIEQLLDLQGVGQAGLIAADPLGLRNFVLARLAHLSPARGSIFRGHLLSADRQHLLIMARPAAPGTDTTFARRLVALFQRLEDELDRRSAGQNLKFSLTPVGAYRAALDNENIVRRDVQRLILFAALGIIILLVLAFPRPSVGLLALVPAVAGTLTSFFFFSLWHESISILTIGFGGAIISITVDHGIAYLLFLDRPDGSSGREAAREVWSVGLLATLTTVGAFAALQFSGFPLLAQIGQFAAIGIAASFLFVHLVFPHIIPQLPPARRKKTVFLRRLVPMLFRFGGKYKAWAALGLGLLMAAFARPGFNADFRAMNTIRPQTAAAENKVAGIWGDVRSRIFIMTEAGSLGQLQKQMDRLTDLLQAQESSGALASAFTPSMLFPGKVRAKDNLAAWRAFWNEERRDALRAELARLSRQWGFTRSAFSPFLGLVDQAEYRAKEIPEPFFELLGIQPPAAGGRVMWRQFSSLRPGQQYRAAALVERIAGLNGFRVFDPAFFSVKLGEYLASTFLRMAAIVGVSVLVLVFIFFFDWRLAGAALLPVAFALSCTLGTLRLIGHPLDIPGLMLSIVVMGMGIDYTLFLVRGYQRYRLVSDPLMGLIQTAVFLAAVSTLIGFGTLNFAQHRLLQSAGLTCVLGVGYAFLGAFMILPSLLQRIFSNRSPGQQPRGQEGRRMKPLPERVMDRYRHTEALPRLQTWFRLRRDPLFDDPDAMPTSQELVLDIGSGFGTPAAWLLEVSPRLRIIGIEPRPDRARLAALVIGSRGVVHCTGVPQLPHFENPPDAVLMIDVLHLLSRQALTATFQQLGRLLPPKAPVVIRCPVVDRDRANGLSPFRRLACRWMKRPLYLRTADEITDMLAENGFTAVAGATAGHGRKGRWFVFQNGGD